MKRFIKRYLPKSLFGRALLILLAPVLLLQAVVAILFIQRHYAGVTEQMAGAVARELNYAVELVETGENPDRIRRLLAEYGKPLGFELTLEPDGLVEPEARWRFFDVSGGALAQALKSRVTRPITVDLLSYEKHADVRIQTGNGVIRALIPRRRTIASNPHLLLVWTGATAILLVVVAVAFLRNQVRPIRQLAFAADSFGKGRNVRFRPGGAEEVRRAGAAFLDMRRRIERQIEQRTMMLSGVSHDLRTPLTRMKLALALEKPSPERDSLARDVVEMERMLEEFLDFARGEQGEPVEDTDPVDLADEIAADARRAGTALSVSAVIDTPEASIVPMRRGAVKRCLANLIDNAGRYGETVALSVRVGRQAVEFTVEDDGPGIPPEQREDAFRAFNRLDAARNQDAGGGVGLGLSIALDIARAHGGSLTLDKSERLGGLKAVVRLPR
jgi:two-component system osmolarity sensor histidine kinase EnvZ